MVRIVLTVARRSVRTVGRNTATARWPLAKWVQAATTARVPAWTAVLRCTHETTIVPVLVIRMALHMSGWDIAQVVPAPKVVLAVRGAAPDRITDLAKARAGMVLVAKKVAVANTVRQ